MLTTPWALLALAAVPIVLGIYLFRTRSRRYEVSALFLWVDRNQAKQGGRRLRQLQLPLLILLEILTLLLLAVAAARPMIRTEVLGRPTAIILDTSYSMTAGRGEDTAQKRALDDLHRMIEFQIGYPIQFILAGPKPQLVAGRAKNAVEARQILQHWVCRDEISDLDAAMSLAANVSTPGTKILVATDHAPDDEVSEGKVLWKSYGKPLDNLAVVHANRTFRDDKDRLLLEIANFSRQDQTLRMNILEPQRKSVLFRDERTLGPLAVHRIRTGIPDETGDLEIRLDEDALKPDNRLTILPPNRRPVRVKIGSVPSELRPKLEKALEVSGLARIVEERPELVFDSSLSSESSSAATWLFRIVSAAGLTASDGEQHSDDGVKAFVGPYVINRQHALSTGLSLDGVVWSGSETFNVPGTAIISAGDVPLLIEQWRRDGSRLLTLQLDDRLSTLTSHPAWPALIWNLLKYRSDHQTGIAVNNLKLGSEAEFVAAEEDKTLKITTPDGQSGTIVLSGASARIPIDRTGVYTVEAESGAYRFAAGTLSSEESNLLRCVTETRGNWFDEETLRSDFTSIAWILLLGSLVLLTVHYGLVSASRTEIQAKNASSRND